MSRSESATGARHYDDIARLRAIRSPIRQEIIDWLKSSGESTAPEIAEQLGVSSESLYFHLGALEAVGLIQQVGAKPSGRKPAALYDVPKRRSPIHYDLSDPDKAECYVAIASAILRLAARDWKAAVELGEVTAEGPQRDLRVGRVTAWLDARERAALNRHISAIVRLFDRSSRAARKSLVAFTFALAPLKHRPAGRSARGGR